MKNKRDKLRTNILIITIISAVCLWICTLLHVCGSVNQKYENIIELIVLFVSFILVIIGGIYIFALYFKDSFSNFVSCNDKLFDELDYYKRHWKETNEHYKNMINAIDFYYKQGGKVDTVIGKDLKRLYNRKDFLNSGISTTEHMNTCFTSVGLSICTSLFFNITNESIILTILNGIAVIILFFAVLLYKYNSSNNNAFSSIYEYELKLLQKKISEIEQDICDEIEREDILLTKQNVIVELMNKCKFILSKKAEEIDKDIRLIEKLDLNIKNTAEYKELNFTIGKTNKRCTLYLDENNRIVNDEYKKLYKMLLKYNMICEIESEDE